MCLKRPTCGAELDDLAPLRDGVVPVRLLGGSLDGHGVLCARTQEPMTSHRHRQGNRLCHQLRRYVLKDKDTGHGGQRSVIVLLVTFLPLILPNECEFGALVAH